MSDKPLPRPRGDDGYLTHDLAYAHALRRPAEPLTYRHRCPPQFFQHKYVSTWGGYPADAWWYILGRGMVPR